MISKLNFQILFNYVSKCILQVNKMSVTFSLKADGKKNSESKKKRNEKEKERKEERRDSNAK